MKPSELSAAIGRQIRQATGAVGDEISAARADLFERYMGEPYGDEKENHSSVVSTDIADTIEWIMPELMEIFTAGDRVVEFNPEGPEDEAAAEQETDTVNYVFYRQNDGWLALYSFIKDGLIQKTGYLKRYWEEREKVTTEEYDGLNDLELAQLMDGWARDEIDVEFLRHEEEEGEFGVLHSIGARLTREEKRLCVVPVPVEELIVSPRWNSVFLDDCPFVAHRRSMTVSDLVEMGYDKKQVEALPDADDDELSDEKVERFSTPKSSEYDDNEPVDSTMREVLVHECYLRVDYDGDGRAELRKVMVGGTGYEVLRMNGKEDNEEVECVPFSAWTPIIIPHKHYGRSIAELITDLQRIKTVLMRQSLDNVYHTNNPTREIAEPGLGENTLTDLLVDRPGKIIRTRQPGMYFEHAPTPFLAQGLQAIEYVDTLRENRTGVTRYNQGLDADSLNKTATGVRSLMTQSQKKIALIARICAETGLKHLFLGIHGDLRRNSAKAMTIKLRNEYVEVDPRSWKNRSDMTISVGLGTGDRESRMAYLTQIIMEQKEHLLTGSPMVTYANLYNTYEKFIEGAGFKNPQMFFTHPDDAQQQPQQPSQADPMEGVVQAEMMKAQMDAQSAAQKLALDAEKAKMEDDRERDRMNMEFALRIAEMNAKNQTQIQLGQIKADAQAAAALNQPPKGTA